MTAAHLVAALIAFGVSVAATGAARSFATRRGLLDQPDAARRTHRVPTPRLGGLGMLAGLAASLLALPLVGISLIVPMALLVGGLGFFLVGLTDDLAWRGRGLAHGGSSPH